MGRGLIKAKNNLKRQYMKPLQDYCKQLEAENAALKGDPGTLIGQFIGQFRELYSQNARLSVLTACLIKKLGENVVLSRDEMEQFQTKRINIKWEIADGETMETAKEFTFTYELTDAPEQGQPVQKTENPDEIPECTDPNCTLPKDLKHRHMPTQTAEGIVVSEGVQTTDHQAESVTEETLTATLNKDPEALCEDPDCPASENGPHIHASKIVTP